MLPTLYRPWIQQHFSKEKTMKFFLALSLFIFCFRSFADYTPMVEVTTSNDKTIHVVITNDSGEFLTCKYSVTWFVDIINFKKAYGKVKLAANDSAEITIANDRYAHLAKIKARALCK